LSGDSLDFVTAPERRLRRQPAGPCALRRNDPQSLANFADGLKKLSGLIDRNCLLSCDWGERKEATK
jgi:hypothetical protein